MSHTLRRLLPALCLLALTLILPRLTHAQGGPISYPPETEMVRGMIEIRGSAMHPEFWKYELAAAAFGTQNWFNLGVSETPVQNNVLGRWDTRTVPDGTYTLRIRIVKRDGNYDEYTVQRVLVANSAPLATPTPEISPTPTVTPTPPPATATPVLLTPIIPTPTLAAANTATPTPLVAADAPGPAASSTDDGGNAPLTDLGPRAAAAFLDGARLVLLAFLFVGLFFAVKNLLTWLVYRFFAGP
ncbi:MAG: hypothetical protein HUU23_18510 [Caldilineales bacterium]|nr:hypothetical protein [Caldilineales bacterium]